MLSVDAALTFTTIALMLYGVLAIGLETYNPIHQIKLLRKRLGVLKGIAIVVTVLMGTVVLTNRVEASEYHFEMEVGLDLPVGQNNIGCIASGDQIASNINIRALMPGGTFRYGLIYNHQSCAANDDRRTSDRIGATALLDYPYFRFEIAAQTWKDGQARFPITGYTKLYTRDQYQFVGFVQKQFGTYNEASYGLALNWRF